MYLNYSYTCEVTNGTWFEKLFCDYLLRFLFLEPDFASLINFLTLEDLSFLLGDLPPFFGCFAFFVTFLFVLCFIGI